MALVSEDGTGKADAESFVSVSDADTYFGNHGSPAMWTSLTTAAKESALRYATRWLSTRYQWPGTIVSTTQALAWPRSGAYDSDLRTIASNVVPQLVIEATCEAALGHVKKALNKIRARGGKISSASIGRLVVEYMPTAPAGDTFPYIDELLSPIAPRSSSAGSVPLVPA